MASTRPRRQRDERKGDGVGRFYDELDDKLTEFIQEQRLFFVATAAKEGRVNVSPKGMDTFRVLGPRQAAYLDLTGSGSETAAHVRENGRLTVMFFSMEGKPMILRLFGAGRVVRPTDDEWLSLVGHFNQLAGQRQIVVIDIESVQTSCGMAAPLFTYTGDRRELVDWAEKQGPQGLADYRRRKNRVSIDGLPTGLGEE